ncbi:MAG: methylmalonyl Co-A mutase-associated GTPase MeaB [Nitrospira sp.]|uniref:Methylmalonyl Co-A mutase-associated GTPase MeaB n=1 Tax=Nitrospira defluvii TaxID=330214 RepID=A0ABM8R3C1_9BACT|nr:methylmalonyl Co-A mutase-associated GTPase MeaB [Nitrospira defluvii]MCS6328285.1 methylmalonyl Co-A mutase-associated GTPase MeaB [Nitrospira sp.]CAE6730740.1 Methylmalonyl Co-A mutase-associated GTPase MeaB [Nitrospira defluvii]
MDQACLDRSFMRLEAETLADQIARGEIRAIARVMSLIENRDPVGTAVLAQLTPSRTQASVIGITGYPGTGKSTLIDQLITAYRRLGQKVGVLAVDISSPITGGAILGDRIRMQQHANDPMVFIRSMATRGHQGGLAGTTGEALRVLKAAAYDVMLIETVGVGQNELEIVQIAPIVVAVVAPGLGDEIQAMKAGLLEVADIVVMNKADHDGADRTMRDLREQCRTVLRTVAHTGEGISELIAVIAEYRRVQDLNGPRWGKPAERPMHPGATSGS